jgi:hypothetical protein
MSFKWNFRREPDISNYDWEISPKDLSEIATEQMQGYRPNTALVPGSPVEQGIASMNGYTPNAQFSVPNYRHGGDAQPDLEGYGESLEAASEEAKKELQRQARIEELKSQIELVQNRINENIAKLNNFTGSIDDIASLEAEKINSTDPTSIWRWNVQRQDTKETNDNLKKEAIEKFKNEVNKWKRTPFASTVEGIDQQISNLNSKIVEGENIGADVSELYDLLEKFEKAAKGELDSDSTNNGNSNYGIGTKTEQLAGELKTVLTTAKTSKELIDFKNSHKSLTPEQVSQLDVKIGELQDKEESKAEARAFEAWLKQRGYKNGSAGISSRILSTLKRQYKRGK